MGDQRDPHPRWPCPNCAALAGEPCKPGCPLAGEFGDRAQPMGVRSAAFLLDGIALELRWFGEGLPPILTLRDASVGLQVGLPLHIAGYLAGWFAVVAGLSFFDVEPEQADG